MCIETDLKALSRSELKDRWLEIIGRPPPPRIARTMMARILACELQWKRSGTSRATTLRKLKAALAAAESARPIAGSGARLVREWNGKEYIVDVSSDGYLWRGQQWKSLSALAKEITGTKWSGPRFFGVSA